MRLKMHSVTSSHYTSSIISNHGVQGNQDSQTVQNPQGTYHQYIPFSNEEIRMLNSEFQIVDEPNYFQYMSSSDKGDKMDIESGDISSGDEGDKMDIQEDGEPGDISSSENDEPNLQDTGSSDDEVYIVTYSDKSSDDEEYIVTFSDMTPSIGEEEEEYQISSVASNEKEEEEY
jgi:hypothetical protein